MVRTLSIGTEVDGLTDCVGWNEEVNINDYNIVYLNLHQLDTLVGDGELNEIEDAGTTALPSSDDVGEHMAAGNTLVVILPTRPSVTKSETFGTSQPLFSWSPFSLDISFESGSGIKEDSIAENWEWYFNRQTFGWNLYIERRVDRDSGNRYTVDSFAENTYHKAVAGSIKYGYFDMYRGSMTDKSWLPGKVFFLPVLDGWSYEDIISDSLYYVFDQGGTEPSPEEAPGWVNEHSVPGEEDKLSTVEGLQMEIEQLQSQLADEKEKLEEIQDIKGLLYGGDDFLERLVPRVLREIGFEVEGEIPGGRDGLIDLNNTSVILETHGTTSGISKEKCRQLDDWVRDYQFEDPEDNSFGMLVVNPKRKEPPEERNGYYNTQVTSFMDRRGHKVLTTPVLYEMYVRFKEGGFSQSDVEEVLIGDEIMIDELE